MSNAWHFAETPYNCLQCNKRYTQFRARAVITMIRAYFLSARVQSAIRKRGARVTKTINAYALNTDNPHRAAKTSGFH